MKNRLALEVKSQIKRMGNLSSALETTSNSRFNSTQSQRLHRGDDCLPSTTNPPPRLFGFPQSKKKKKIRQAICLGCNKISRLGQGAGLKAVQGLCLQGTRKQTEVLCARKAGKKTPHNRIRRGGGSGFGTGFPKLVSIDPVRVLRTIP